MNGTVTVLCVKHEQVTEQDENGHIRHVRSGGRCFSQEFTVRRERRVGIGSATHELMQLSRSRGAL